MIIMWWVFASIFLWKSSKIQAFSNTIVMAAALWWQLELQELLL